MYSINFKKNPHINTYGVPLEEQPKERENNPVNPTDVHEGAHRTEVDALLSLLRQPFKSDKFYDAAQQLAAKPGTGALLADLVSTLANTGATILSM